MLSAEVRTTAQAAVIDLHGDIVGAADDVLTGAYEQAAAAGIGAVVLNFHDVSYMNSTGIALVVGMLAMARKAGLDVRAYGLSDHYKEIFEITRLADFVGIFPDEQSAVAEAATS